MKLRVHYIKDSDGKNKAVKLDINDWNHLKKLLEKIENSENEPVEFIETPVKVTQLEPKLKSRRFSDFIMDI
mgnify:FL=1